MKKFLLLCVTSLMLLLAGCSQFDASEIWDAIEDLTQRVEDLEEECQKMNTNIEALQAIVGAQQSGDTITSIAPIKQGDKIIGYTITFSQSEPITIYHGTDGKDGADGEDGKDGADGKDGYTPTIGVAQDEDGAYYWTLDGEWLLDENGNKIKAVGTDGKDGEDGEDGANGNDGSNGENGADGKDGITPQLEIRDGYWYISYDNGATWKELGKATGEDGKDGADGEDGKDGEDGTNGTDGQDGKDGDSLFQSVTWDEEYAYFTLSDGTVIAIPLSSTTETPDVPTPEEPETPEGGNYYEKVTANLSDWSGSYLIVWANGAHATVSGKDLAKTVDVTIENNKIAANDTVNSAKVTVVATANGYSLQLPNGKYLSLSINGNQVSESAAAFDLNFAHTESGVKILGTDSTGNERVVTNNGTYYRAYKTSTSTTDDYTLPNLYKLVE